MVEAILMPKGGGDCELGIKEFEIVLFLYLPRTE
jgi:hypothetical protein